MSKIQHVDAQLLVCETLLHRLWWSAAVPGNRWGDAYCTEQEVEAWKAGRECCSRH